VYPKTRVAGVNKILVDPSGKYQICKDYFIDLVSYLPWCCEIILQHISERTLMSKLKFLLQIVNNQRTVLHLRYI